MMHSYAFDEGWLTISVCFLNHVLYLRFSKVLTKILCHLPNVCDRYLSLYSNEKKKLGIGREKKTNSEEWNLTLLSWSMIWNAFMSSSFVSLSPIFAVIMCTNSSKSIAPLPSLSTSAIICLICWNKPLHQYVRHEVKDPDREEEEEAKEIYKGIKTLKLFR